MRKDVFIKELEYLLQDIPDEDKADAIAYYQDYLEEAGLELLRCVDCGTLEKTDFGSWTAYCVAQKRK